MITIITQLTCAECEASFILTGNAPQRQAILTVAKDAGWHIQKAAHRCPHHAKPKPPQAEMLHSPQLEPFFSVTVANTQDKRSRHYGFRAWAKVVNGLDLAKTGGYAFTGEEWVGSKYIDQESTEAKYFFGKYPDFALIVMGFLSGGHCACVLIETDKAASDVRTVEFGRSEKDWNHVISFVAKGGRVIFAATSQRPKRMIEQAVTWGATADMMRKATSPYYFAAMYLQLRRDEWKYKNNPFAIIIE